MQTAILFLVFNRPDVTQRVFEAIRDARPPRLYIAADGPRIDRPDEEALCEQTRQIVSNIDWPCEISTLFRDENLGCRVGVSTAIDWFFEHEEEGIILEDDCLPDESFFVYCEELLDTYKNAPDIMAISGDYFHGEARRPETSYYFSRYNHCWGWASWRRAWQLYDRDMSRWPELRNSGWLTDISGGHSDFSRYWTYVFDKAYAGEIDSWAYRWLFSCWIHHGLTALPSVNLVKNIGFGDAATHTTGDKRWEDMPLETISFPLKKPENVERHVALDRLTDLNVVRTRIPVMQKAFSRIKFYLQTATKNIFQNTHLNNIW